MGLDFGLAVGLEQADLILALLMVQFIGFPAALAFGKVGEKIGAKIGVLMGICAYVAVTVLATFITRERPWLFFVLAGGIGLFQGGVQALSRSLFARLIPQHKATELFGFYNMLGKFAAVLGPSLVGLVSVLSGEPRYSILAVLVFLVPGGVLLALLNVEEGERIARDLETR
jgi:UMF1 family MFS transporter